MHVLEMLANFLPRAPIYWGDEMPLPRYMGVGMYKNASIRRFFEHGAMLADTFFGACGGHLTKKCYNTPRACS